MEYRNLGKTGLRVSRFCLGAMTLGTQVGAGAQVGEADAINLIKSALAAGVNCIDTANIYPLGNPGGSEEIIGKAVKGIRDSVVLSTKVRVPTGPGPNDGGLSRKHIMKAIEDSLRRLQTDYIDVYITHTPDYNTPIEETLRTFDDLVSQGKVRYICAANCYAWYLAKTLGVSELQNFIKYTSIQVPYNLLARDIEVEMIPLCESEGIGVTTYNPLAGEMLTGRHEFGKEPAEGRFTLGGGLSKMYLDRYWDETNFKAVDRLKEIAKEHGCSLPQFALAWILSNEAVTSVLSGTISPEQLEENLAATEIKLSEEELKACDEVWQMFRPTRHSYITPMRRA
ncbi:aldo/keto reductase [Chloroflexota bacterium]